MIWAIWINFLPLSPGGSTWNWLQLALWFQRRYLKTHTHTHTHTFLHTRKQQLRVVPDKKRGGGRELWRQSTTIFLWGVAGLFFFQSSWQLAFVKMYNFLKVMVLFKNAVCSNGICWNEKMFIFLEEALKKKWVMLVPWWWWFWLISWPYRWLFSREVKSRRIHFTVSR